MSEYPHSLLISDLHLAESRPDLNQAFTQFCRDQAARAKALYILGDLCDAWIGDDDDSPTATLIRSNLKALVEGGVEVYLMTGNRDFLIGKQLADDIGLTLLPDPSIHEIEGHRVLLMHGDSMCTGDQEYMAFRAQIQNPDTQAMLMSKSLDERRAIAAMLRSQSKSANANKAEDIMDVTEHEVVNALQNAGVNILIHGHTHRPAVHKLTLENGNSATRYVLGDWDSSAWKITVTASEIELTEFNL